MQLITRIPRRDYFITIFVIVSVLFLIFSAVIYRNYREAQRLNSWTLYNYEVIRQSREILLSLVDMETGVRGYLLIGDKKYLEPFEASQKNLSKQVINLLDYTESDKGTQSSITVWLKNIEPYVRNLRAQVQEYRTHGKSSFSAREMDAQKRQMDNLRTLLESFIQSRLANLTTQLSKASETRTNFNYILGIGTVLAIGGMLFATLIILALSHRSMLAEKKTRKLEDRFQTVMNAVNDGLFDFNAKTGTEYYSPAYKTMLGYREDELMDTSLQAFNAMLHPDDYTQAWEVFNDYMAGKTPQYRNVFRMRHKNGDWVWILSRGVGIKDDKGVITNLIGAHTDITEQKKREEEIQLISSEMETFAYITSHDLRAPLVNLRGFAGETARAVDTLKPILAKVKNQLTPEEQKIVAQATEEDIPESLNFIDQAVERMDVLTNALLDLSRIGKREYQAELVDTQAIVKRCLNTLAYEITRSDIAMHCGPLPTITSDPLAVEQVFSNILDNAVKYLDPARKGEISVTAQDSGNNIMFSVKDNGRGIAPADHHKVFHIFRRARNSSDVRGLGMGMAFVQSTLRRLGGTVWFESEQGKGSTFSFTLPKHPSRKGSIR